METLNDKILEVTAEVGKFKNVNDLEGYINTLPSYLKSNGKLKDLFQKRRNYLLQLETY